MIYVFPTLIISLSADEIVLRLYETVSY